MTDTSSLLQRISQIPPERRADFLRRLRGEVDKPTRADRADGDAVPLTLQQEQLWILSQFAQGRSTYNVPVGFTIRGPLDVDALRRALRETVAAHDSFRTVFDDEGGVPVQRLAPPIDLDLAVEDLTDRPGDLDRIRRELAVEPFDLRRGPLIAAHLLRLAPEHHELILVCHHIVFDGWSLSVVLRELDRRYRGDEPKPETDTIAYADYATWQRRWLDSPEVSRATEFWQDTLRDSPPLTLPTDFSYPAEQSFDGDEYVGEVPAELLDEVEEFARARGVSALTVWLAGFAALLHRHTGQTDLVLGLPSSNRHLPEVQEVVGNFVNLLPVRTDAAGDPTFAELLSRVSDRTLAALEHQALPYQRLVEAVNPPREPNRLPLVQGSFNYQTVPTFGDLGPDARLIGQRIHNGDSRFELSVEVGRDPQAGYVACEYNVRLFERRTIERLAERLLVTVAGAIRAPERRLSELTVLPDDEYALVTDEWARGPVRPEEPGTIVAAFDRCAAEHADRVAVTFHDQAWTYRELAERANRIANHLLEQRVQTEDRVAVWCERSPDMVAAILGVLKAGAAYVPVDRSAPAERLGVILRDAEVTAVVSGGDPAVRVPRGPWLSIDLADEELAAVPADPPRVTIVPRQLAYAIYTSGSTGRPKGVLVEHAAVTNFIHTVQDLFELTAQDNFVQFAALTFDVSVFEIFGALLTGATLHVADDEQRRSTELLTALLREREVTVVDLPPAVLELLDEEQFPALRIVFVGGEAFSGELTTRWGADGRRFFNGYGPTETTVTVVAKECAGRWTSSPPIGRAMANHTAYALDPQMRPVPIGAPGELYIGGAGMARGYLCEPNMTARAFVPDPYGEAGGRLYRTGDLVRWNHDGDLVFLGRVDRQVKVRGLRIEPGEIEEALADHPQVRQAVVEAVRDDAGNAKLIAYVVTRIGTPPPAGSLRTYLDSLLPAYMVPNDFLYVDEIPLTASGKVDVAALPTGVARESTGLDGAEPRTETERRVIEEIFVPLLNPSGRVGVEDNFFQLGGSSLQATQLLSRIKKVFGVDIAVGQFFQAPTAAGVARAVDAAEPAAAGGSGLLEALAAIEREGEAQA